jgi:GWxTD domain-containing protein
MRRLLLSALLAFACAIAPAETDYLQLFMKAKEQFRLAAYSDALTTLARLEAESERPGNEAYRARLQPGLVFYRAACLSALGRSDEARPQFELFLTYQPGASLDRAAYPPKVIAAFEDARRGMQATAQKPAESGGMAASYRAYAAPEVEAREAAAEDWGEGPIGYLMSSGQKEEYSRLSDSVARSEFVALFWKSLDPKPETPDNEAREEFERRVAFADSRFAQDETRGSLTDRGLVFVLLGPPTWVGRKPLATGEDTNDPKGMSRYGDLEIRNALRGKSGGSSQHTYDFMTGPGAKLPDSDGNYREVWHYRRELLPAKVSFQQVDFDFITRKGYGRNVLQREGWVVPTLEAAREATRAGAFARTASR